MDIVYPTVVILFPNIYIYVNFSIQISNSKTFLISEFKIN